MIVDDVSIETLKARGLSDGDIRAVRTFAAFLRLPKTRDGRTICPPTFYAYAKGEGQPSDEDVAALLEGCGHEDGWAVGCANCQAQESLARDRAGDVLPAELLDPTEGER